MGIEVERHLIHRVKIGAANLHEQMRNVVPDGGRDGERALLVERGDLRVSHQVRSVDAHRERGHRTHEDVKADQPHACVTADNRADGHNALLACIDEIAITSCPLWQYE